MKSIFATFLIIASFSVNLLAQGNTAPAPAPATSTPPATPQLPTPPNFEAHKAAMLSHMTEKNVDMEKFKACVSASKTPMEMHKCRQENRQAMKGMRMHNQMNKAPGQQETPNGK